MGKIRKNKNRNQFDEDDDVNDDNINDKPQQKSGFAGLLVDDDDEMVNQESNQTKVNQETIQTKTEIFNIAYQYDLSGNYDMAIQYYLKAENLGSRSAIGNLAILFDETDDPRAEKYYVKSICAGNIGSLYDYAEYLTDHNDSRSFDYFKLYMSLKDAKSDEKLLWKKVAKFICF